MLAIRADADARIGLGHAMRCFALAEAWRARGGDAAFFSGAALPDPVLSRLDGAGIARRVFASPDNGDEFAEAAAGIGARWLVVDGSFATPDYLDRVRNAGLPMLLLDDAASAARYPCDLLLNQNVQALEEAYAGRTEGKVLAGPRFALIRADMCENVRSRIIADRPQRILVLVGGADPGGHLEALAQAAEQALLKAGFGDGHVDAVIGPASNWQPPADAGPVISYHRGVKDMGSLIDKADLAISSAGSTVWELSLHGTPMILGASVPVEEPVGAGMAAKGAALYLGRLSECPAEQLVAETVRVLQDSAARRKLSTTASALVDGRGAERVIDAMLGLKAGNVSL
ncbi:PseG/SpsG family protein [Nisaea nitritireducens]|uniref:PseG/SpsG family protein n=1 Tax=Nisaea nitritireducens TaxID=568392 RepID=UPI0018683DDD|nr:hypothetical protein [Nisaea nitritireducens]